MRVQTIEALLKSEGLTEVENTGMGMPAFSGLSTPRRVLKGRTKNISMLTELYRALNINYCDMTEEMLRFIKTRADNPQLPADSTELGSLPVERFSQLEIQVADFQETDRFQIHRARCTGAKAFHNCGLRNDWVWVQTGEETNYRDLRGHAVA